MASLELLQKNTEKKKGVLKYIPDILKIIKEEEEKERIFHPELLNILEEVAQDNPFWFYADWSELADIIKTKIGMCLIEIDKEVLNQLFHTFLPTTNHGSLTSKYYTKIDYQTIFFGSI